MAKSEWEKQHKLEEEEKKSTKEGRGKVAGKERKERGQGAKIWREGKGSHDEEKEKDRPNRKCSTEHGKEKDGQWVDKTLVFPKFNTHRFFFSGNILIYRTKLTGLSS